MAYSTLTSPQFGAPLLGSVEVTAPSGLAWGPSDWFPLQTDMSEAILTGVAIRPNFLVFFGSGVPALQLEIGVDVDDVQTKIAAWPIQYNFSFNSSGLDHGGFMPATIGVDLIPEGCTLLARLRSSTSDFDHIHEVAATYIQKPLVGSLLTTTQPKIVIPEAASPVTVTSGTPAWTFGSLATIRAASGPAFVCTGISIWTNNATTNVIDVDLYADGVFVHRERAAFGGKQGMPFYRALRRPLDAFPIDSLIQAQVRTTPDANTGCFVYLDGHEKPL